MWSLSSYELLLEATTRLKDSTDEPDAKPGSCQEAGESTGKPDARSGSCRKGLTFMDESGAKSQCWKDLSWIETCEQT